MIYSMWRVGKQLQSERAAGMRNVSVLKGCFATVWGIACCLVGQVVVAEDTRPLEFNRDIRPILSNNCFLCHGFDHNARKANLRLDLREEALRDRDGTHAIVPGDPAQSALVRRIFETDPDHLMPPPESERRLSDSQKELLRRWIEEGAAYQPHWAYLPITRPDPPQVQHEDQVQNPIDSFLFAKMEQVGLDPAPDADRATVLRRLSFDLLGLPPTPEEVASFEQSADPDSYEKCVEAFLASPHYGERMAVDWLDQVRYADTNGYHGDEHRSVYPFRDYVINAFNANMPFDQFTIEQFAGDLLPDATIDQRVASTYNRLNQITAEGGAQAKEYIAKYAADRVRTLASVWLGTTLGCAECHDHKFDPFTMKDFYSFEAFFADIEERGVYGAGQRWDPLLLLPSEDQKQTLADFDEHIATLQARLDSPAEEVLAAQRVWEGSLEQELATGAANWSLVPPSEVQAEHGTTFEQLEDGSFLAQGNPEQEIYVLRSTGISQPVAALRLEALPHEKLKDLLSRGNGNFVLTEFEVEVNGTRIPIASAAVDFEQTGFVASSAIDGDPKTGWAVDGHKRKGEARQALFRFAEPIAPSPDAVLTVRIRQEALVKQHTIGRFRLTLTSSPDAPLPLAEHLPEEVTAALKTPADTRSEEQWTSIRKHFTSTTPLLAQVRDELDLKREARAKFESEIPYVLLTRSVEPREIRLLPRGNWLDESGPVLPPATPESLPPLALEGRRPTRLDLAQWLTSSENPLPARVVMNRLWRQFFGTGLSKALNDIGSQGEWPTHPELLDWLASEFIASGWDMKHMARLMVTSAAYRRSSRPTKEMMAADPFNRLLACQSRFRLEAEFIRDNALAVSGLLSPKIGGRSVFPYQPDGYYANCNTFTGPLIYTADTGEEQYRRGLYTYWKRSFLHPSILAFDAPTREECTAERSVSNTPLQALALLNDPSYVEASRVFAEHIFREGGEGVSDRIAWAFRRAVSRAPSGEETLLLANLYVQDRNEYLADESAARELLQVGQSPVPEDIPAAELAAWTSVARAILNLHETINRA